MPLTGRLSAAILIGVGVALISLGTYAAVQTITFLPSLNLPDPPLARVQLARAEPGPRLTERVVLIIVDGLRLDASRAMTSLERLRALGIDAEASSHYPSMSRPNYAAIITGVPPQWSGVRSNHYRRPVPLDSAPKRAQAARLGVSFVSQTSGGPRVMFGDHVDHAPVVPRPEALEAAIMARLASDDAVVAILVDDIDDAGHEHGAVSGEYAAAVARVDRMLARVLAAIDLQRQTVIIVSDHGHIDSGGHGGLEPEVMRVPLVLAGAGIRSGAPLVRTQLIDVAPTICALLGIPPPRHALGLTLVDALTLELDARDAVRRSDVRRIQAVTEITTAVRLDAERVAWTTRVTRGGLALFLLAALITGTAWLARRRLVLIDLRVLAIAVPSFPLIYYAMVLTLEHLLTPSMVPHAGTIAIELFLYGLVAAAVHTTIAWLIVAHRTRVSDRVAAAAGLVLTGTIVMLGPAAIAWVIAGPPFTAQIPGPDVLMLPPTTYAAVTSYCFSGVVFVVIAYVGFLRARRHGAKQVIARR